MNFFFRKITRVVKTCALLLIQAMESVRLIAHDVLLLGGALSVICLFFFLIALFVVCVKWIRILNSIQTLVDDISSTLQIPLALLHMLL